MSNIEDDQSVMAPRARRGRGTILVIADQGLCSACNFLTAILIARALGLEGFGIFSMAWLAVLFATSLQLGLTVCPMISIGPAKSGADAETYYGAVLIHEAAYVTVAGLAIWALLKLLWIDSLHGLALPAAIAASSFLLQDFVRRYLFARARPRVALAIDVVNQGCKLSLLAMFWWDGTLTATAALWTVAAGSALSTLCAVPFCGPVSWRPGSFAETTRRQWESARWLVLTGSIQWILAYTGPMITAGVLGLKMLGALRVAQSLMGALNVAREILENVVPPMAGRAFATDGLAGLRVVILRAMLISLCFGGAAVLVLAAFGNELIGLLYGHEAAQLSWIIKWYCLVLPITLVNLAQIFAFRALEQTRPIFIATVTAACISLTIVYPAALSFGVAGIVGVTILSEATVMVVLAFGLRNLIYSERKVFAVRQRAGLEPAG